MSRNSNRYISQQLEYWANKQYGDIPLSFIASGVVSNSNDLHKLLLLIEEHNDDAAAGTIEVKMAIGDIVGLCWRICYKLGMNYDDVFFEGCQRMACKMQEMVEGDTSHDDDPRYFPGSNISSGYSSFGGDKLRKAIIKVTVNNVCDKCPFAYFGQYCMKCKAMPDWKDIPVTIEDTKTKVVRPHYIPDWCPNIS